MQFTWGQNIHTYVRMYVRLKSVCVFSISSSSPPPPCMYRVLYQTNRKFKIRIQYYQSLYVYLINNTISTLQNILLKVVILCTKHSYVVMAFYAFVRFNHGFSVSLTVTLATCMSDRDSQGVTCVVDISVCCTHSSCPF